MLHLYIFIYLFLAHLLADFVFQPDSLIAWKHKHWKGVLVHALIVFVVSLVLFWPFIFEGVSGPRLAPFWENMNLWGIGILLVNAALHFFVDLHKIKKEKRNRKQVGLFLMDQFFHIAVLLIATLGIGYLYTFPYATGLYALYTRCPVDATCGLLTFFRAFLPFAIYLILAILSTFVYEIFRFQVEREKNVHARMKFNYHGMAFRLIILSLVFIFVLFLSDFHIARTFFG